MRHSMVERASPCRKISSTSNMIRSPAPIALGWNEGMEICEILQKSEIQDGWLCRRPDGRAKPTKIVTRVDGSRFSEFWLSTVGRKNAEASIVHA
jgi:hypothetical protein